MSSEVPLGRLHHVILDAADPMAEANFWSRVLGHPITYRDDDFVVVAASDHHSGLAFQLTPGHVAPDWPGEHGEQQVHLDVMVDDLDAASQRITGLGATPLPGGDHVFADPAGHPFCLITRPGRADPVGS